MSNAYIKSDARRVCNATLGMMKDGIGGECKCFSNKALSSASAV